MNKNIISINAIKQTPDYTGTMVEIVENSSTFPIEVFPPTIQDFIKRTAISMAISWDFVAVQVIATFSVAIGTGAKIKFNDWCEYPVLWFGIVAPPGSKKSPSLQKTIEPLQRIQEENKRQYDQLKKAYEEEEISSRPHFEQMIVQNTTVEALVNVIQHNSKGVLNYQDELTAHLNGMNQYKSKGSDKEFWLSSWSCSPTIINRSSKEEPIILRRPFVTLIGNIPNDKLSTLTQGKEDDGHLDRYLCIFPKRINNFIKLIPDDHKKVPSITKETYSDLVEKIHYHLSKLDKELICQFDEDAYELFENWHDKLTEETLRPNFMSVLEGSYEKLRAYCLRLILILHMIENPTNSNKAIAAQTVNKVCTKLMPFFKLQLHQLYGTLVLSNDEVEEEKVVKKIFDKGVNFRANDGQVFKTISSKNLMDSRPLGRGRKSKEYLMGILKRLEDQNLIIIETKTNSNGTISQNIFLPVSIDEI